MDYILWDVFQGGLEYAYSGFSGSNQATSNFSIPQGKTFTPKGKLNSGFKVGIGCQAGEDNWDISLVYTWIKSYSKNTLEGSSEPFFYQVPYSFANINFTVSEDRTDKRVTSGDAFFKIFFNVVDLILGKSFFVTPKIVVNPYFGLKGSYQIENYNNHFIIAGEARGIGPKSTNYSDATSYYATLQKQTYGGIGPKIGCYSLWNLSENFGVFADAGLSNMWSWYKSLREDSADIFDNSSNRYVIQNLQYENIARKVSCLNQVLETRLGFSYNKMFSDNSYRFMTEIGWEGQLWFNQNQLPLLNLAYGNLSLQGLNVTFRLDF